MPNGFRLTQVKRGPFGEIVDTLRLLDGIASAQHLDPLAGFLGEAADAIDGLVLLVATLEQERVRLLLRDI